MGNASREQAGSEPGHAPERSRSQACARLGPSTKPAVSAGQGPGARRSVSSHGCPRREAPKRRAGRPGDGPAEGLWKAVGGRLAPLGQPAGQAFGLGLPPAPEEMPEAGLAAKRLRELGPEAHPAEQPRRGRRAGLPANGRGGRRGRSAEPLRRPRRVLPWDRGDGPGGGRGGSLPAERRRLGGNSCIARGPHGAQRRGR